MIVSRQHRDGKGQLWVKSSDVTSRGEGAKCPPETFHRDFFADLSGKTRQGKKVKKMENVEESEEKGKGKMKHVRGKHRKKQTNKQTDDLFIFVVLIIY